MRPSLHRPRKWSLVAGGIAIGIVVSLSISFAAARWSPQRSPTIQLHDRGVSSLLDGIRLTMPSDRFRVVAFTQRKLAVDFTAVLALDIRRQRTTVEYGSGVRCSAGWPLHAWLVVIDNPLIPNAPADYQNWFWSEMRAEQRRGTMSICKPLWTGLIVNSSLFACVFWGMILTPPWLRRKIEGRRRDAGECARCRYTVRGTVRCPECGELVDPGSVAQPGEPT